MPLMHALRTQTTVLHYGDFQNIEEQGWRKREKTSALTTIPDGREREERERKNKRKKERQRTLAPLPERDRQTETETQTERDGQTETETERERERQRERTRVRERERTRERQRQRKGPVATACSQVLDRYHDSAVPDVSFQEAYESTIL